MTKKITYIFFLAFFLLPIMALGQENADILAPTLEESQEFSINKNEATEPAVQDIIFEAKILEILEEKEIIKENGLKSILQKMRLQGLEGKWENKEFVSEETEIDTAIGNAFKKGDRVSVSVNKSEEGKDIFYVGDFIRRSKLYFLSAIFFIIILLIGKWRGLRAILGLGFSFFVILNFIIPKILSGANPLYVSLIYSFLIIIVGTYLVYGFNKKSTISIFGISISIAIVGILSVVFTDVCRLAGFAQEETLFIANLTNGAIDLRGLLLAGFIIGALGVLDDLVISQVSTVQELNRLNLGLSKWDIYKRAMRVGVDHISSMVNTLFLAYAGASLPLLLLFTFKQAPFLTVGQVLNHEVIATEIIRTLVGSIGLALAVPIATFLAAYFYANNLKGADKRNFEKQKKIKLQSAEAGKKSLKSL